MNRGISLQAALQVSSSHYKRINARKGKQMARKTKTTNKAIKVDLYERITNEFLAALDRGMVPWHNPVKLGNWPANLVTQKRYRGVNVWTTSVASMANEYTSRWWLSYAQANEMGGQVRKGEKATKIVYWLFKEHVDSSGKKTKRGFPLYSSVFNADQVDGIEDKVAGCGREECAAGIRAAG
jgi:antirestriction protein ArdC